MLTHCVRVCGGKKGRATARARRNVATGGNWKVEQRAKGVAEHAGGEDDPSGGGDRRRTNGFYLGSGKGKCVKTPWLKEELTTEEDEADAAAGGWRGETSRRARPMRRSWPSSGRTGSPSTATARQRRS